MRRINVGGEAAQELLAGKVWGRVQWWAGRERSWPGHLRAFLLLSQPALPAAQNVITPTTKAADHDVPISPAEIVQQGLMSQVRGSAPSNCLGRGGRRQSSTRLAHQLGLSGSHAAKSFEHVLLSAARSRLASPSCRRAGAR